MIRLYNIFHGKLFVRFLKENQIRSIKNQNFPSLNQNDVEKRLKNISKMINSLIFKFYFLLVKLKTLKSDSNLRIRING